MSSKYLELKNDFKYAFRLGLSIKEYRERRQKRIEKLKRKFKKGIPENDKDFYFFIESLC